MKYFLTALLIMVMLNCRVYSQIKSVDITSLVNLMEGSYSTQEQASKDSGYKSILLDIKRIWPELSSAQWLYVEYSSGDTPGTPYKQQVYKVMTTREGRFRYEIYEIPDAQRFVDDMKKDYPLSELKPDELIKSEECDVTVTLMDAGLYEGGVYNKDCRHGLNGAVYKKSEVMISKDGISVWEKGYDENDIPVWGNEKGGYFFKRM